MKQLRILILSDDHFARRGLATLLNGEEGYLVVASHESTVDLAESLVTYRPDLLLWDLGWDPEDALARLSHYVGPDDDDEDGDEDSNTTIDSRNQNDLLPIVALIAEAAQSRDLPRRNIQGVLLRDAPVAQLTSALNAVAAGLVVFAPGVEQHLLTPTNPPIESLVEPLTPRELEILQLIAEGLANKAIARQLEISDHTVKFHTTAIFGKLGVSSRTEAVVRATRAGLILL